MKFSPAPLAGVFTIDQEPKTDNRGFFARAFCAREFAAHGIETAFVQMNSSLSVKLGTLRGLHYQLAPDAEVKLVRCVRGQVYDVVLDLRKESPTFGQSFGAVLSADNRTMMVVPRGCAHGFLTLEDDSELLYMVSAFYAAPQERGVRFNDPAFKVQWPMEPVELSEKDKTWPLFDPAYHLGS